MNNKIAIISAILTVIILICVGRAGAEASKTRTETQTETSTETQSKVDELIEIESSEIQRTSESVDAPKVYDVPLSVELQLYIIGECEKYNITPSIIIAMIERESNYKVDAIGDNGDSLGLMQIQPKWHQERMNRLGVTDLLDPFQNVTVGIDFVAELKDKNPDLYWVLMAYNGGEQYADRMMAAGTISEYALVVTERLSELERMWE